MSYSKIDDNNSHLMPFSIRDRGAARLSFYRIYSEVDVEKEETVHQLESQILCLEKYCI